MPTSERTTELGSQPLLATISEAAEYLRVSQTTIRRMVRHGSLAYRRVGNQIRITRQDLESAAEHGTALRNQAGDVSLAPIEAPEWAKATLARWREGVRRLIPADQLVHIVVMDRRGAKTFTLLDLEGFDWGKNLWHSNAVANLSDGQLKKLFQGAQVIVFDEMVQHGRKIAAVRQRLSALGLPVTCICIIRRRSHFLAGEVQEPEVRPVEDLEDEPFVTAAVFLSRLLARRFPPMDVEHIVVQGFCDRDWDLAEVVRELREFGQTEAIWSADENDIGTVDAFSLNRPSFFDPARIELPEGISARWDAPIKIRGYYEPTVGRISLTFICFPTLEGHEDAWAQAIVECRTRFGAGAEPEPEVTKAELEQAYADICTNVSLDLLRQAVEAGLPERLRITKPSSIPQSQMVAVFGPRRGRQLTKEINTALRLSVSADLFPSDTAARIPTFLDPNRRIVRLVESTDARDAVLALVPAHWIDETDQASDPVSYIDLLRGTSPADETSITCALDYELDAGTVQPTNSVRLSQTNAVVQRAFWRGEYDGQHLQTYDDIVMSRTRVVCTNGLALWLRIRKQTDEGELNVAKLFANLVHDWGSEIPPLAMQWTAWKFGAVPNLPPPADRYLLPILVRSECLTMNRAARDQRRYAPRNLQRWTELFKQPLCPGIVTARVKGLVKAYAAIQRRCKTARQVPGSAELRVFSDPLVVLASARNEQTAYRCAQYEVLLWIQLGVEQFFPNLSDAATLTNPTAANESLRSAAKEFAQAGRFLYEKLEMYRNLPELRQQIVQVFEEEAIESGDIVLDSVETAPRFSRNPIETRYPVGLLQWAVDVIRPFTSLVRQVLSASKIDRDDRRPADREITASDGTKETKDAGHYLKLLLSNAPEMGSQTALLHLAVDAAEREERMTPIIAEALRSAFLEIVKLLKSRLPDLENPTAFDDLRQRRDSDLMKCSRSIAERLHQGFVAVGDFYNFRRLSTVTPFAADAQDIAERIKEWIEQSAKLIVSSGMGDVYFVGINSDTVVLAGSNAEDVVNAVIRLRQKLTAAFYDWDHELGTSMVQFMRFGVAQFDANASDAKAPMRAVSLAFALAEHHGLKRGSITVTSLVRTALSGEIADAFPRESEWNEAPTQGPVWAWSPGKEDR